MIEPWYFFRYSLAAALRKSGALMLVPIRFAQFSSEISLIEVG